MQQDHWVGRKGYWIRVARHLQGWRPEALELLDTLPEGTQRAARL